jgi:NAD(P)-dependent dehydrogenase (short-subunit alcohol dehydrogenase family)
VELEEGTMADISKSVLITGCSTGIGRATAEHLAEKGWTVYATARRPKSIADLEAKGCKTLALDVTDEASMQDAVRQIEAAEGAVGVLVNNAGYSQSGAVESVKMEDIRAQFDTNVFGLIRMSQLVLPGMRRQGWGKIVNVSSIGGRLTFPGGGIYHATKHAVEAISDALRFEVRGFGVDVVVIEPGLIRTQFADAAVNKIESGTTDNGPYGDFNAAVATATAGAYKGPIAKLGGGPETVAHKIEKAISRRRPKTRYPVTPSARIILGIRALLPDRGWDAFNASNFPRPKP